MLSKMLCTLAVLAACVSTCASQDLTVRVVDESSQLPVKKALIRVHYGCWQPMLPVELKQTTNDLGVAVLLSLRPLEFCVFPDYAYSSIEKMQAFTSPENAESMAKFQNKPLTSLPATITFHVRRLSFSERLRNFFRYD